MSSLHRLLLAIASLLPVGFLAAQASGVPLNSPTYRIIDRLDILSGVASPIHSEVKYFSRQDVLAYAIQVDSTAAELSRRDQADLQYIFDDNNEWLPDSSRFLRRNNRPVFKTFYRTPANLFEVNVPDFQMRMNPLMNLQLAQEQGDAELVFENHRGVEIRGTVDHKLFFYTSILESQARYPGYVTSRIMEYQAVPGAGFYKNYDPRIIKLRNAYDFNVASAYLGLHMTRHVSLQLGHGRHFIGNGYRSLLLSDYANNGFYLKLSTRVWRFHYQNLFMELSPISNRQAPGDAKLPKKYVALHYLSYKVTPRLSFAFFEATVFNRSRQFEFQYLNPVILYRTVEGMLGSPDNVIIGLDGHWNLLRRFQLYGQVLLDEFKVSSVFNPDEKGWWANKFGLQTGLKYMNAFGVDHLDLQLEFNAVRPYTYSHRDSLNSYTHFNQPLAHPLLANFREIVGIARYQPSARLYLEARIIHANTGDDTATENWGTNPLLSYTSRVQEYGNKIGQGVGATIDLVGLNASWMLYHNLYIDAKVLLRKKNSVEAARDQSTKLFGLGLRMNVWHPNLDF